MKYFLLALLFLFIQLQLSICEDFFKDIDDRLTKLEEQK